MPLCVELDVGVRLLNPGDDFVRTQSYAPNRELFERYVRTLYTAFQPSVLATAADIALHRHDDGIVALLKVLLKPLAAFLSPPFEAVPETLPPFSHAPVLEQATGVYRASVEMALKTLCEYATKGFRCHTPTGCI
ncbi:MAG: hypothetical protein FJY97_07530 [candidate division Zixibacteria bacterium]|nr:hypothetical protein [candidate division Zixibacteria bacterium]